MLKPRFSISDSVVHFRVTLPLPGVVVKEVSVTAKEVRVIGRDTSSWLSKSVSVPALPELHSVLVCVL